MKKLFTLIAFLACVMGAKAEWVQDYKVDYSAYSGFPFYVMGYVPEWVDGVMTDMGGNYKYVAVDGAEETSDVIVKTNSGVEYYRLANDGTWHQYFIADGIPTELDGTYTMKAMVRATEPVGVNIQMRWSWSEDPVTGTLNIGTDWEEVECTFSAIGGTSCSLIAQPNTAAMIEWKYVIVGHDQKAQRPIEWLQQLNETYRSAETPWGDLANVRFDDQENNFKICAWGKENGRNVNENGGSDPFPCDIEEVEGGNHAFVVHAKDCTDPSADASAWDNQFWIQSEQAWKAGTQVRIKFRYKASQNAKTQTQFHKQNPSDYLHWQAVGDVDFTTEWQEFDKTITLPDAATGCWSIAFNLNPDVKTATDFYFDDLSWEIMKLDYGYFVASANTTTGIEYDFDNATEFVVDEDDDEVLVATVGTAGDQDSWVNEVMISTVRGNDAAFKGATLKPTEAVVDDADTWINYKEASLAKVKLPAAGVWKISIAFDDMQMNFVKLEGEETKEPIEINPNPAVIVVKGQERDYKQDDEHPDGTGQDWDNQLFIKANRALSAGEETIVEFDYYSTVEATSGTQCHGEEPGSYMHWNCLGTLNFTPEEQHLSKTLTVSSEADGMWCIAFNMAEIKEACDYTIKNVVWKLADNSETLIDMEGTANFYVKEGAGTAPYVFGTDVAVRNITNAAAVPAVTFNLAGQRVANGYKGLVVKNGKKTLVK